MKISVTINVILALATLVLFLSKHVTFESTLPAETPAVAPVDSSLLWTDFSHMDTIRFEDKWLEPKSGSARLSAIATYHDNGMVAMSVFTRNWDFDCNPAKEKCYLFQELSFFSPNGYKIAEDTRIMEYKEFLAGIFVPKGGTLWYCTVSNGQTKNPLVCPEPPAENHIYNHQVKEK